MRIHEFVLMQVEELLGRLDRRLVTQTFTEVLQTPSQQTMFLLLLVEWLR
jgi:hypothetical protein